VVFFRFSFCDLFFGKSFFGQFFVSAFLQLHNFHIVFVSDSSDFFKVGIFEDGVSVSEEVVNNQG